MAITPPSMTSTSGRSSSTASLTLLGRDEIADNGSLFEVGRCNQAIQTACGSNHNIRLGQILIPLHSYGDRCAFLRSRRTYSSQAVRDSVSGRSLRFAT